jgi:hypothetical protein
VYGLVCADTRIPNGLTISVDEEAVAVRLIATHIFTSRLYRTTPSYILSLFQNIRCFRFVKQMYLVCFSVYI